jgi:P2 family phage contractile tail tube protein
MLTFTLVDYNEALIKKVAQKHLPTQLIFRGALEEESTGVTLTKALEVVCVGKVRSMEGFEVQAGQLGKLTFEMSLTYYRHKLGDTVTHEIDVNNLVRVIDGIDQLLPQRLALGL